MNKGLFNKVLPHLVALIVFLVIAVIYCRPALQGNVVSQSDVASWKGANKQSLEYKEKTGHYPLWTNSLFSGMPTFMIAYDGNNIVPWTVHSILTLGLPIPIQFFFLACICFYFLAMVLRVNPYLGIMGALAFAYATYNPVIISVGHDTKMWSIAYMPAVLASILLIFDRKYWIGAGLTALFCSVIVAMNHLQITYYLFLIIGVMMLFFIVRWIMAGEWKHLLMCGVFTLASAVTGILVNSVSLFSTYEYQKETIRGGSSELADTTGGKKLTGLDKDYALSYSMKLSEPLVMLVPHMYGGSNDRQEMDPADSKVMDVLGGFPAELQQQLPVTYYWGGLSETGIGTSGPPYVGAIICFLAIIGMFILDNKHKWWMMSAVLLAVIMSWGSFFEGFNVFLYEYLPFYNKFRAPSMTLVIPQLLLPVMATLTMHAIITAENKELLLKKYKKGLIAVAVVFGAILLLYSSMSFLGSNDKSLLKQVASMNQPQLTTMINSYINALKDDRRSLMMGDTLRSLGFIAVAAFLIFLSIRNKLNKNLLIAAVTLLVFVDLILVDVKYLNAEHYVEPEQMDEVQATEADRQIKADTSYYRVFNAAPNRFSENTTSYFHNSLGGYHAAKLKIYQDLIEHQLNKSVPNLNVLNMLNAKYIIQTNPQNGQKIAQLNPDAYGACWLVKTIRYVPDANAEMKALDNTNLHDTAVVQEKYRSAIPFQPQWDSAASIKLIHNANDYIKYQFSATANQFAAFSEIYYQAGWKAFIDGKETPIVKVDYVLRGLPVAAGNHTIEFRFEPNGYLTGRKITLATSIVMILLLLAGIWSEWRKNKKTNPVTH